MSIDPTLRIANKRDANAIQDLVQRELFLPDIPDFHWHLPASILSTIHAGRYAVAEWDGALAGVLALAVHDGELYIDVIAVEQRFQRRGVARSLVEFAERAAHTWGFQRLIVSTFRQYKVETVYERLGFEILEQDDSCTWLARQL